MRPCTAQMYLGVFSVAGVLVGSWYHPAPVAKPQRPQLYRTAPWARYCDPCLPRMRSDCTVRWPIPIPSRPVFPLFLGRAQLHTAHAPYPRPLPEVFHSPTCHNCPSDTSPRTAIALLFSFCFVGLRTAVLFCFGLILPVPPLPFSPLHRSAGTDSVIELSVRWSQPPPPPGKHRRDVFNLPPSFLSPSSAAEPRDRLRPNA